MDPLVDPQHVIDEEHLRLLRIGYLIAGGWNVFWAFFPLIYVAMGLFLLFGGLAQKNGAPDEIGWVFVLMGSVISLLMTALAIMKLLVARSIRMRRGRVFCLVVAAIGCLSIPYGTALGVATFLVVNRPSVQAMFASKPDLSSV